MSGFGTYCANAHYRASLFKLGFKENAETEKKFDFESIAEDICQMQCFENKFKN